MRQQLSAAVGRTTFLIRSAFDVAVSEVASKVLVTTTGGQLYVLKRRVIDLGNGKTQISFDVVQPPTPLPPTGGSGQCFISCSPTEPKAYITVPSPDGVTDVYSYNIDANTFTKVAKGSETQIFQTPCFSPDGKKVYVTGKDRVAVFSAQTDSLVKEIQLGSFASEFALTFTPDGKKAFTGADRDPQYPNSAAVIDAQADTLIAPIPGLADSVTMCATYDNAKIYTTTVGSIAVLSTMSHQIVTQIRGGTLYGGVASAPQHPFVAACSDKLELIDSRIDQVVSQVEFPRHANSVNVAIDQHQICYVTLDYFGLFVAKFY